MPPPLRSHRRLPPSGFNVQQWKELGELPRGPTETAFLLAVYDDDVPKLRELVAAGNPHINHLHDYFPSALELAVHCDDITALDILLEAGACPELRRVSIPEISPMIAAIRASNSFVFQRLREYAGLGDDEDSCRRYCDMLKIAASAGHANIVSDILVCCPDGYLDRYRNFQWSILDRAASYWRVEVVRLLLERFVFSALDLTRILRHAVEFPPDILDVPYQGPRLIDYTYQQQIIHLLIDAGADPNSSDGVFTRANSIVTEPATHIDLVGALKALLERGADPNGRERAKNVTALHRLGGPVYLDNKSKERRLHEAGIRILLDHGASVLEKDAEGNTPLHYAAFGSNLRVFRLLSGKLRPDMNPSVTSLTNSSGEGLLHWAAAGKKYDICQYLLAAGTNVNCASITGWTPLLCAVAPSRATYQSYTVAETANLLLQHSADPLVCSAEGWTLLHCVAAHLDREEDSLLAKLAADLVARGAPVNQRAIMLSVSAHYGISRVRVDSLHVGYWGSHLACYLSAASQKERSRDGGVAKDATPLHWAAFYGAVGPASVLVVSGADVQVEDASGFRPYRPCFSPSQPVSTCTVQVVGAP